MSLFHYERMCIHAKVSCNKSRIFLYFLSPYKCIYLSELGFSQVCLEIDRSEVSGSVFLFLFYYLEKVLFIICCNKRFEGPLIVFLFLQTCFQLKLCHPCLFHVSQLQQTLIKTLKRKIFEQLKNVIVFDTV